MSLFDIIYILCLGGLIILFCSSSFNLRLPFLSDRMRCRLLHNFRFSFKLNEDDESEDEDLLGKGNGSEPTTSINVGRTEWNNDLGLGAVLFDEDLPGIIRGIKDQLTDPSKLQNIGSALDNTLSTILNNDMLRKAFVEDLQGLGTMETLRSVFKHGVVVSPHPGSSNASESHTNNNADPND